MFFVLIPEMDSPNMESPESNPLIMIDHAWIHDYNTVSRLNYVVFSGDIREENPIPMCFSPT